MSPQAQPLPLQPVSPPVVPHQAPHSTPKSSLFNTVTIQAKPSVTSEMSCIKEHDPLLPDNKDTPLTIPCNAFFKESPLLTKKSSSHDNVSNDICDLFVYKIYYYYNIYIYIYNMATM